MGWPCLGRGGEGTLFSREQNARAETPGGSETHWQGVEAMRVYLRLLR